MPDHDPIPQDPRHPKKVTPNPVDPINPPKEIDPVDPPEETEEEEG